MLISFDSVQNSEMLTKENYNSLFFSPPPKVPIKSERCADHSLSNTLLLSAPSCVSADPGSARARAPIRARSRPTALLCVTGRARAKERRFNPVRRRRRRCTHGRVRGPDLPVVSRRIHAPTPRGERSSPSRGPHPFSSSCRCHPCPRARARA